MMNALIEKYLNPNYSLSRRVLYLATFLSSVVSIALLSAAILLRFDFVSIIVFSSICILSTTIFFMESKTGRTVVHSLIYLCYINIFAFPYIMLRSDSNIVEIPLYSLIGIALCLILLDGWKRLVTFVLQLVVDLGVSYYCFVIKDSGVIQQSASSFEDYLRLEVAIVVSGIFCGLLIMYRNVILEKELRIREEATAKAQTVSSAKDTFLVNVSHEIRTPLNAIIGTTEMVLNSDTNNHVKEMAFNISNSSHALLSITSDLLDFSRMNIDVETPAYEKYDFAGMLNDIINLISVRLLDSNVEFFASINPDLPKTMIGDSAKIRQVIINMLSNAIKFTKEGHMTLYVDYETLSNTRILVKVWVEDTGIGIKQENIEKIFDADKYLENEMGEAEENTGLGLALCRKLSTILDGNIRVESVYGQGSTFFFDFPQDIDEETVGETIGKVQKANVNICYFSDGLKDMLEFDKILNSMGIFSYNAFSEDMFLEKCLDKKFDYFFLNSVSYERLKEKINDTGIDWLKIVVVSGCNYSYAGEPFEFVLTKPVSALNVADLINHTNNYAIRKQRYAGEFKIPEANILVVDDNLVNLDVAAGLLARYDCKVITAASGAECLITLKDEHVDMIFLDYMMPGMDGIDTLKAIRELENPVYKTIPVICLTANVVSGAKEMFLEAGFDDYLSKPIETEMLEKTILEKLPAEFIRPVFKH